MIAIEAEAARGTAKASAATDPPCSKTVCVAVGSQGGFERAELDALLKLPFVTAVGLGPRVLRADTAALSALAVWQAVAGDWRAR